VDQTLLEALKQRATDIHIEPFENMLRIRMRVDGMLFEQPAPPGILRFHPAIVSRIKIMAEMDIAEKRLPQDGRVKLRVAGEEVDLRISTVPTPHGESVEIRILRRAMMLMGLGELGMSDAALTKVRRAIRRPNGIILVTGPTGSGKTTTLYSALNEINSEDKKIITIEDPVEYMLRGVNQIQVKPGIGLSFASGLRSILRHDPDVIMVGEIRDTETAEIAIRAALTGHLVFSTLHTNDAAGAVTRLLDMGVEPFLAASSLRMVVAQRLIRTLCPRCRQEAEYDTATLRKAGLPADAPMRLFQAAGCEHCRQQGYTGRTGIYEILSLDDILRLQIVDRGTTDEIRRTAMDSGMTTLRQDGWDKARRGFTSLEEVLRVTRKD
jgi:type II secretory ATPase GspE/PulE/Tfp pilus assembly ATPase PilB-like protein